MRNSHFVSPVPSQWEVVSLDAGKSCNLAATPHVLVPGAPGKLILPTWAVVAFKAGTTPTAGPLNLEMKLGPTSRGLPVLLNGDVDSVMAVAIASSDLLGLDLVAGEMLGAPLLLSAKTNVTGGDDCGLRLFVNYALLDLSDLKLVRTIPPEPPPIADPAARTARKGMFNR